MQIPLNTGTRKAATVAVVALLATAYLVLTGRQFLAAWYADRPELYSLQRAAKLDPGNAEYRNHIGRYEELVARDPGRAIASYREAVQLDPHSAHYWFDLARAYQVLGDTSHQESALEGAVQADPTTPDVAWEAANLYLVQGENDKALREFHVVLDNDPTLAGPSLEFCWRIQPDVDALLRNVVPPNAYAQFLSFLVDKGQLQGSEKVWDALARSGQPFELRLALGYFRYVILNKEVDEAQRVWRETADRFGLTSYLPTASNLIVNGDFSLDVINGGFDWQYQKQSSVELTLDPSEFHGGRRSLLITFDGPGISDAGILQLVPVQPNTTYDFSAYYKIGEIEGAGAPHFTLQDAYDKTIYYDSDELKEAGFWKSVNGDFTTGPDCKLVVLHVRRIPEGSPIRGKLWIDDFHLTTKQS